VYNKKDDIMKTLVKTMIVGMILILSTTSYAKTTPIRSIHNTTVTKVINPRVVVHKNVKYYHNKGIWYIKKNRRYVTVTAPRGIRLNTLPNGYKTVKIRGKKYYKYKGVHYKKSGRGFIVVTL